MVAHSQQIFKKIYKSFTTRVQKSKFLRHCTKFRQPFRLKVCNSYNSLRVYKNKHQCQHHNSWKVRYNKTCTYVPYLGTYLGTYPGTKVLHQQKILTILHHALQFSRTRQWVIKFQELQNMVKLQSMNIIPIMMINQSIL